MLPRRGALILTPTEMERKALLAGLHRPKNRCKDHWLGAAQLCGFGPIVAAARTSSLIASLHPEEVFLLGIAGVYPGAQDRFPVGGAAAFGTVACYGIGAGTGPSFRSAGQMGWAQWPFVPNTVEDQVQGNGTSTKAQEELTKQDSDWRDRRLLTVCSAAATDEDVNTRLAYCPEAVGEDMEAFGVASACRIAGIPFTVIRGFSNVAGVRNKDQWKIAEALESAAQLAASLELVSVVPPER